MPICEFGNLLLFNGDAHRVRTKVDLVAEIVQIPSKTAALRIDFDAGEHCFVAQRREHGTIRNHVRKIVLAR